MNIPNTLTLARIVLVPLIVWLIITHEMTAAFVPASPMPPTATSPSASPW